MVQEDGWFSRLLLFGMCGGVLDSCFSGCVGTRVGRGRETKMRDITRIVTMDLMRGCKRGATRAEDKILWMT
jgi:hypothetical protein